MLSLARSAEPIHQTCWTSLTPTVRQSQQQSNTRSNILHSEEDLFSCANSFLSILWIESGTDKFSGFLVWNVFRGWILSMDSNKTVTSWFYLASRRRQIYCTSFTSYLTISVAHLVNIIGAIEHRLPISQSWNWSSGLINFQVSVCQCIFVLFFFWFEM